MTNEAQVDQLFAEWDKPDSPGAAYCIIDKRGIRYMRGYGMANLEYDIPITPSTIFDIASVSKQFGALAIAMLANEGRMSLDDDIRAYLMDFPDLGNPITVRHLLHHTSGLRDWVQSFAIAGVQVDDVIAFKHILKFARRQKALNFVPGAEYLYSNTGYNLLAEIVERVTGQSFSAWTAAQIFEPLGMTNTHFHDDHEQIVKKRAYSYEPANNGGFKNAVNNLTALASSSLYTTVEDLAKWVSNFEHARVGGEHVLAQMEERGTLNSGEKIAYAFGQAIGEYRGLKTVDHGGSWRGFRSTLLRFPDQGFAVIILANLSTFEPARIARQMADIYLDGEMSPKPTETRAPETAEAQAPESESPTTDALLALTGNYYSLELDTTYTLVVEDGQLVAKHWRNDDIRLTPAGDSFKGSAWFFPELRFMKDQANAVAGFHLSGGRVRHLWFSRR